MILCTQKSYQLCINLKLHNKACPEIILSKIILSGNYMSLFALFFKSAIIRYREWRICKGRFDVLAPGMPATA